MSEYQYYEFQAVDRPLTEADRAALRAISTRARISTKSFVNAYEWGDLKADPLDLLTRYFDLFLYLANWGTRRFALRLPRRLVDLKDIDAFQVDDDLLTLRSVGGHVIIDIAVNEVDSESWEDDGTGRLAALAPLREDVLAGDLRLFGVLWLIQVQNEWMADEALFPLPGLGPLTAPLAALAEFLGLDRDLVEAAAEAGTPAQGGTLTPADVENFVSSLAETEKVALLVRVCAGEEPQVGVDLRRRCRATLVKPAATEASHPTAGTLRAAAERRASERRRLAAEQETGERRRRAEAEARAREQRLAALGKREKAAWDEVEALIDLRNASGYEKAVALLADLGALAAAGGKTDEFRRRIADLRGRHERKGRFLERLEAALPEICRQAP